MTVTAVAWTSVSRSGHWTFLSSAQQESRKPMTPPRAPVRPRGLVRRVGRFQVGLRGALRDPGLYGLDLGDVTGDTDLGVVLRPRLSVALGAGAFLLLSLPSAALGLALCAGFRHGPLPG